MREGEMLQTLIMEAQDAFKIYYDGRTNDKDCFRTTIYTGVLSADCRVGEEVVVAYGDNQYPVRILDIAQFNKSLQEGVAGLHVGLVFSHRHPELPKANVLIYKAK